MPIRRIATLAWLAVVLQACSGESPNTPAESPSHAKTKAPKPKAAAAVRVSSPAATATAAPTAPQPTGDPQLVSHSIIQQMEIGGGGNLVVLIVMETGEMSLKLQRWSSNTTKMPEPTMRKCPPLSSKETEELRWMIEHAQKALNSASYSTSTAPPPTSDYSSSETYQFARSQRWPEVTVAAWADSPVELAALGVQLRKYEQSCNR
jgi:hypothetical protein